MRPKVSFMNSPAFADLPGTCRTGTFPPVLLTFAGYYGTLAAARCMGALGAKVTVADSGRLAPAKWSHYVTRREIIPTIQRPDAFLHWLLQFGKRSPGHVLYPASDDMAWLIARHQDVLSQHFLLYSPSLTTIRTLLNKQMLAELCKTLGIPTPQSFFPKSNHEVLTLAEELEYPVLIKPLTQVCMPYNHKGGIIRSAGDLPDAYTKMMRSMQYETGFAQNESGITWPMIQQYFPGAANSIYSLSGFVSEDRMLYDFRAAQKVLQYPRKLGIGICFEEVPVVPELRDRVLELCKRIGYWGLFEVEFIPSDGEYLLTDFNPRFYSQMSFDIGRGMPLPAFIYYGAMGDTDRLRSAVCQSCDRGAWVSDRALVNTFMFYLVLGTQTLSGGMPRSEVRGWWRWYREHSNCRYDATAANGDPFPAVIDALTRTAHYIRHPRYFAKTLLRNKQ